MPDRKALAWVTLVSLLVSSLEHQAAAGERNGSLRVHNVSKIWDRAPHNAFTDLVRFKDRWFCVFREGASHVSPDGKLRVLESSDGEAWTSAALIERPGADLRDAKACVTPDGKLMLSGAAAIAKNGGGKTHQSIAGFSDDGRKWSDGVDIGEKDFWIWRTTWHRGTAHAVGYGTAGEKIARLYSSRDGRRFDTVVTTLFAEGYPNEHALVFLEDGTCLCLLRRDEGKTKSGQLGIARPPYKDWTWNDLGKQIGGPMMIRLPDGRLIAGVRLYDGRVRTSVCWVDADNGTLSECLALPSGGDTSYPGMVFHDGKLWVSYYSSHEGKTSIYLAKVDVGGK